MFIEKRSITLPEQKRIAGIASFLLVIIFIFFLLSFWSIQILKGKEFSEKAQKNIHDKIILKAPRGIITDMYGNIIASNRLHFSLFFKQARQDSLSAIPQKHLQHLGLNARDLETRLTYFSGKNLRELIPIKRNLPLENVVYLEARPDLLSFFQIEIEPARAYPFGKSGSHVLGFMNEIAADEFDMLKKIGYSMGDVIGKSGLEKQYENYLRGQKGNQSVIKDNLGIVHAVTDVTYPSIGATVQTTLDFGVQEQIEQIFSGHIGVVAVVELRHGGIIALVSQPNFDPETLSGIITAEFWELTLNDPTHPLQNRYSQGLYSPGSVFKLVVALAGLSEKIISPESMVYCSGSVLIYDRPFRCWQTGGHGYVNLADAIKGSCNVFFYQMGKKLDVDQIAHYAFQLGLGLETGIDLPNEKKGIIPTKRWKEREKNQAWFPGETISVSIGGGWVSVTPAQILKMISIISLRGRDPNIHLVETIRQNNKAIYQYRSKELRTSIQPQHYEDIIEGMWRAVNQEGTARRTLISEMNICGKTGTQQIISKENPNYEQLVQQQRFKPHAWFASFAPRDNPQYAMVVLVENGGDAGQIAVPIAEKVYRLLQLRNSDV